MKKGSARARMLIALLLLVSESRAQMSKMEPGVNPVVTILIYDYAHVPERQLGTAEREVSRVFHHAGVETRWADCSDRPPHVADRLCVYAPEDVGFVMKILPREPSILLHYPKDAFGAAIIFSEGNGVPVGYVFYDRVKAKSEDCDFQGLLTGEIIVHELGHILLGPDSHSPTGIMSAVWGNEELQHASDGALLFTLSQSEEIRVQLAANRQGVAVTSPAVRNSGQLMSFAGMESDALY